jgi:hypothetical protein
MTFAYLEEESIEGNSLSANPAANVHQNRDCETCRRCEGSRRCLRVEEQESRALRALSVSPSGSRA